MEFFRSWRAPYKHQKFITDEPVDANDQDTDWTKVNGFKGSKNNKKKNAIVQDNEEDSKPLFGSFDIIYLGCTPITSKRSEKTTSEAIKTVVANSKAGGRKAKTLKRVTLNASQSGVEVLDQQTKDILFRYTIYQISYCSMDAYSSHTFSFVSSEQNPFSDQEQLSCHVFQCPKRKVTKEVTSLIIKCFESTYKLWQKSVGQINYTVKPNSGNILKEQNIQNNLEIHGLQHNLNQNQSKEENINEDPLINFAAFQNEQHNFPNFQVTGWVQFEDDFRDNDNSHISDF